MSRILFQDLQSCIEPKTVETRTLRLKLSPSDPEPNAWSFITNTPQSPKQNEPLYVHPMSKNSYFSKLTTRSLELCTENLGCETGSNFIENAFFSLPLREHNEVENKGREKIRPLRCLDNKEKSSRNFPPPLTTMSGAKSLQVRPIREEGRLVIQVVEAPSSHGRFQAERSNGRLILTLFKENDIALEPEVYENEGEELEHELHFQKEEENIEEIEEEDFEEECSEAFVNGNMEKNSKEMGVTMRIGKFRRPTRCNEGGLCKWEPLWVATS